MGFKTGQWYACLHAILHGMRHPFESEMHAKRPSPVNFLNNFYRILVHPFFSARELRAYAYLTV